MIRFLAATAAALLAPVAAQAQQRPVAFDQVQAPATLQVGSATLHADGTIAAEYSGYGKNIAPAVAWSGAPPGVRSFVLIVQDPDSPSPQPTVHWVAWNIPAGVGGLQRRTSNEPHPDKPEGMVQGPNDHGGTGWTGPHPPIGDPAHHYHFQIFALDRKLKLNDDTPLPRVQAAMTGHVLAKGQAIGLFAEAPPAPPKAAPKAAPASASAGRSE